VKHLVLEEKVDVNSICKLTGYTPLMYACQVGAADIVQFLLSEGIGGNVSIKSYLSGRDAKQICVDASFDRLHDMIE
jgi:ankyrin repeat protein